MTRATIVTCVGASAIALLATLGGAGYLMFRDEILAGLIERQAQMQYAYEDRLAAARLRLDQVTSKQFVDQDGVEGKVQNLVMREALLETRAAVVAQLVEHTVHGAAALPGADQPPSSEDLTPPVSSPHVAVGTAKPSPASEDVAGFAGAKPHPEGMELRLGPNVAPVTVPNLPPIPAPARSSATKSSRLRTRGDRLAFDSTGFVHNIQTTPMLADAADSGLPLETRLENLALSLDRIERDQTRGVESVAKPALAAAGRLRRAFDEAGLPAERYVIKSKSRVAMGGPFIPVDLKTSDFSFDRKLATAQNAVATLEGLRRALPSVPLRQPLSGELQITSRFGYRTDPFLGRPALHSGVDLRDDYGTRVRATAGGVVTAAGPSGGYGNMVEVDHGGGLATRYGHLSAIDVTIGQQVAAGETIGAVGSTGRSTGPHLHYEVRSDGEAVDPSRFLRAASVLNGFNP